MTVFQNQKFRYFLLTAFLLTALLLAAVAGALDALPGSRAELNGDSPESGATVDMVSGMPAYDGGMAPPSAESKAVAASENMLPPVGSLAPAAASERLIVRTVDLALKVDRAGDAIQAIGRLAEEAGGFVVSSSLFQPDSGYGEVFGAITIRVPAEKLDAVIAAVKDSAIKVESENRYGQDVTAEYTDLDSQLRALQAAEEQLTEIMQDARRTEDVLAVYNQLAAYRRDIEIIQGQMKYYEQAAALSLVTISLREPSLPAPVETGEWSAARAFSTALQDLVDGLQVAADLAIRLGVTVIPLLLAVGIPIWLLFWIAKKIRERVRAGRSRAS